jgi:hypothetical protein
LASRTGSLLTSGNGDYCTVHSLISGHSTPFRTEITVISLVRRYSTPFHQRPEIKRSHQGWDYVRRPNSRTRELRVFLLDIRSHFYSFALRLLFLLNSRGPVRQPYSTYIPAPRLHRLDSLNVYKNRLRYTISLGTIDYGKHYPRVIKISG